MRCRFDIPTHRAHVFLALHHFDRVGDHGKEKDNLRLLGDNRVHKTQMCLYTKVGYKQRRLNNFRTSFAVFKVKLFVFVREYGLSFLSSSLTNAQVSLKSVF